MMLALWTFRCYVLPSGRDDIDYWYGRQNANVQAAFDVAMEFLAQRPRHEWRRPQFDMLSGKLREIGEIRFYAERKQHRILGFFGPRTADFTLLVPASKKGQNYDPRSALDSALKRKNEVMADGSRCHVCDF